MLPQANGVGLAAGETSCRGLQSRLPQPVKQVCVGGELQRHAARAALCRPAVDGLPIFKPHLKHAGALHLS